RAFSSAATPCPTTAPCCSDFGFCGAGTFCLGGCNPFASNSVDACMPAPVCQSSNYTFADLSRIQTTSSAYDGDASKYDWVVDGGNVTASNGAVAMILTETNGGTRLSSTRYVHYGNITARIKAGRWAGVVTAFITMSDIKDEIDWEWPGNDTTQGQSNWFWQGVVRESNNGISDIYENWHDYGISWTPTALSWLVDGKVVRTVAAADSLAGGVSEYPSTPSRIELSIWPAGISSSAPGTVAWADGMIDWTDPDYVAAGNQFEVFVSSVSVTCGDPTAAAAGVEAYVYGANTTTNTPGVAFSSNTTVLSAA
ncbi:glycoside hydrolase family 16 protein, partial [Athelia psychrophila]